MIDDLTGKVIVQYDNGDLNMRNYKTGEEVLLFEKTNENAEYIKHFSAFYAMYECICRTEDKAAHLYNQCVQKR